MTANLNEIHSLLHHIPSIILFGSPNGLCSSITESKHIKAVKEPWRRSSRYKALTQMLVILTRLDKLAALRTVLRLRGMLSGTALSYTRAVLDECGYPRRLPALAARIDHPQFPFLLRRFLHEELHSPPEPNLPPTPVDAYPYSTVESMSITPPSPISMRPAISVVPAGYVGSPKLGGLVIGRVQHFLSFGFADRVYECALVKWLVPVGDTPDPDTGMWVVKPERERGALTMAIINLDAVAGAAHLLPVYGTTALPENFHFSDSLDAFDRYFVNPYADHHMHEFLALD
ncbi:hypothetical protein B0H14DRAFT_3887096 [Mycena olivaceomarginata]|nr:hypothetical protein B0H14DRAFT_3887096 [Mycena olivaceomarginata]